MEGPDEPVFSGFRDAEILVASNKGQVFSELISSFDNQIDISKSKGEKEKTKSKPSYGQGLFKLLSQDFHVWWLPHWNWGWAAEKHI